MNSSVEDILEKRITELEKKLFGIQGLQNNKEMRLENSVVESVSHATTLISSALSGREKIAALIQRLPELENYAESDFEPVDLQTDMKLEYILAMEPEIRENLNRLNQFKTLAPVLESNRFNSLSEVQEKFNNLSLKYIELGEDTEKMNAEMIKMTCRYNDVLTNISKTLITLDTEIVELEKVAESEKVVD